MSATSEDGLEGCKNGLGTFFLWCKGQVDFQGADVVGGHVPHRDPDGNCSHRNVELLLQVKDSVASHSSRVRGIFRSPLHDAVHHPARQRRKRPLPLPMQDTGPQQCNRFRRSAIGWGAEAWLACPGGVLERKPADRPNLPSARASPSWEEPRYGCALGTIIGAPGGRRVACWDTANLLPGLVGMVQVPTPDGILRSFQVRSGRVSHSMNGDRPDDSRVCQAQRECGAAYRCSFD